MGNRLTSAIANAGKNTARAYRKYAPLAAVAKRDLVEKLTPGMEEQRYQTEDSVDDLARKVVDYGASGKISEEQVGKNLGRLTYGSRLPEYDENRVFAVSDAQAASKLERSVPDTAMYLSPTFMETLKMRRKDVLGKYDNPAENPGMEKGLITMDLYKGASETTPVDATMQHERMHAFDMQGNHQAFRNNATPPTTTPEGAKEFTTRLNLAASKNTKFGSWLRGFIQAMSGGVGAGSVNPGDPHLVSELYAELMTSIGPQDLMQESPELYEMSPWK